ncbi:MAG: PilZ domain-containing protein [Spirochaetales bacterium]|nr:PilZ domain-containing protein [Spirochaetales bacterium]
MWIAILLLVVIGAVTALIVAGTGKQWREFYVRGADAGFSIGEMKMLKSAAEQAGLESPVSIFFSIDQLDHSISVLSRYVEDNGIEYTPEESTLLRKLYEYRKTIEFNKPRYKSGLKHTIELKEGQPLKIALGKSGLFKSEVLEVDENFLVISYPSGNTLPQGVTWRGQNLRVYFQKKNDASYYFESRVKDDYFDRSFKLLHIAHSGKILRSQRRNSVRTKAEFPVTIFPLQDIGQVDNVIMSEGGFRGEMQDISEDGASLIIGGKGKEGLLLKLQFQLSDSILVVCGIIRYFEYNPDQDRSILHLQFMRPDEETKNKILSFVYDVHRRREAEGDGDELEPVDEEVDEGPGTGELPDEEVELLEMIEDISED